MKGSATSSATTTSPGTLPSSVDRNRRSVERFHLTGPSAPIDARVNAVRRDIADIALADRVFAPHYVRPQPHVCGGSAVAMRKAPAADAVAVSELLPGEAFAVLEISGGWAWGYSTHDHYVGYVPDHALIQGATTPTHIVTARSALLFAAPDIKSPLRGSLPIGSRLGGEEQGAFLDIGTGFVHLHHVRPIDRQEPDPVAVALRLLGAPYLWGGRGGAGVDCSGLVQLAFARCGIALPRDSDQQQAAGIPLAEDAALDRGDILFFPGHVGLMTDATHLIHANAHAMAVTIEPLADVVARLTPDHARPIVARRRVAMAAAA